MDKADMIETITTMSMFDKEDIEDMSEEELQILYDSLEIDDWQKEMQREHESVMYNADEEEGFGGSGFGGGGFGTTTTSPFSDPAQSNVIPSNPATPPATIPATPAPSNPSPTTPQTNSYGDKKTVPAKVITVLPVDFLKAVQEAANDLPQELRSLGIIGATLTKFEGIEPCPPCHTYYPPKGDDENDTGLCVYQCADDEVCAGGECVPPEKRDPPCKATMRFGIGGADDRMCRVEAFNVVFANETSDDGFSWGIEGQSGTQYSYVVLDRSQPTNVGLTPIPTASEDSSNLITQNYTAGSAQPKPRMFQGNLSKGIAYRIPNVSAESEPVKVLVTDSATNMTKPANFTFYTDSADNLYLECTDLQAGQTYDGAFIVQIQYKNLHAPNSTNDKSNLYAEKMTFNDLKAKAQANSQFLPSMPPLDADAQKSADYILQQKGYSMDSPIGEVVEDADSWLNAFVCKGIPKMTGEVLPAEMYVNTNAGACRHRAFLAFLMFNRLGLPTRFCTSSCHAWPEIYDFTSRVWVQIDLNGCGDDDPEPCGACTRPNPKYGVLPDEPECLPVECPENYYCDPQHGKCVPDCSALYPDGNHHYNPRTDKCEECTDGKSWNPILEMCECAECPDEYSMNENGRCVKINEDGTEEENETAPLGIYTEMETGLCLPIPDCDKERAGTIFNPRTGQCECPIGVNPLDNEAPFIAYKWDDVRGMCMPDVQKMCPEGQWWDELVGRCRPIPENPINRIPLPSPDNPEVLEDVIVEDGKVREALTGFLNPKTGEIIDKTEMKRAGQTEESIGKQGYTVKWETLRVAKNGKPTINVSETLQGISQWVQQHDFDSKKLEVLTGWSRSNATNRLIYKQIDDTYDFDKWVQSWERALNQAFPNGRFTILKSPKKMEIVDSMASR